MYSSAILAALCVATSALAVPTFEKRTWTSEDSGLQVRGLGYQGDGFYSVNFDGEGKGDVAYIPLGDLDTDTTDLTGRSADGEGDLIKRAPKWKCDKRKSGDLESMREADKQLRQNAEAPGEGKKGTWGWVHIKGETAYFCNYKDNSLSLPGIAMFQNQMNKQCEQGAYAFYRNSIFGDGDLAVGRAAKGMEFCSKGFTGFA